MATKKKSSKKVTKAVAKKTAKKVAKKAVKKVTKKVTKKATKKIVKKAATKAAPKKIAKKVAKKAVTKKATKKAVKKVTKKAVVKKSVSKKTVAKKATSTAKKAPKKTSSKAVSSDNLIHGIEPYKIKAREKYMSPAQTKHFRNILLSWKTNLLDEVSRTIHLMQDENINHPDPNDRASQETDMSLELRNRDRERKLLKKIDATIARVDIDDYGWCDRCGIEIGVRRLEARPTAELCVDCKTLNEIKERQMI